MIDTLAESHSTTKRFIENEYTRYDYFVYVTRKNLEGVKEKYKFDTQNPKSK